MFWGVTILPGRRYAQTVEMSYHISKAALEIDVKNPKLETKRVQLMLEHNNSKYLLCNLDSEKIPQTELDLIFTEGEKVVFYLNGEGTVHLTGYILDFQSDEDEDEEDEELDETILPNLAKRKLLQDEAPIKKTKTDDNSIDVEDENEDDEDEEDEEEDGLGTLDMDDGDDDNEDDEEEEDEDEDEEMLSEKTNVLKKKDDQNINGQVKRQESQNKSFNIKSPVVSQQQKQNQQQQKPKFGQQTPNSQKFGNQQQKGQNSGQKFNQKPGQFNPNKPKGPFTPGNKANKFNKNKKGRTSMA